MAYLPLSTANLPDPVIDPAQGSSPEDYFAPVTWTGNGTSQSITGVGHQTDMIWAKCRSLAVSHIIYDVIRGVTKRIIPDRTEAEETQTNHITSFDSDGFSLGNSDSVNKNATTYVGWSWKAGGSGVSNTDGSITSTVSANTESGFSICSYVGNSTTGATVGHGLSQAPEFIMVKDRDDGAQPFSCFHASVGNQYWLRLDSTSAPIDADSAWNDTSPSSTVFTLGAGNIVNQSGNDVIAYCFHSVDGFSKFGSYVGNDSGDGNFIYTGFSPALIVIKYVSGSAGGTKNWYVWDNARSPQNVNDNILYWNTSGSEGGDSAFDIDRLSNGFKLRNAEGGVNNAATYIYMAWAESPFKYSNAR